MPLLRFTLFILYFSLLKVVQPTFACSKSTKEMLEIDVKYIPKLKIKSNNRIKYITLH